MKKLIKIIYWLVVILLLVIAATVAASSLNIPGGIKLFTVQSGSMEPKIKKGSLIISKSFSTYSKDDIITFKSEKDGQNINPKITTTHRIYEVKYINNVKIFVTKGDANNAPDAGTVDESLVLGKVVFSVSFLGYPISFAKTKEGLIVLVVIPATIIIYGELLNIKNEAQRLMRERKKKLTATEKIEIEIGEEEIKIEKGFKKFWDKIKRKFNR
ncbi:MAG: signal peptidase I [Candidatus Woesebacteria bacterium]|nr:signal peptidase I [Candidatus Woesebacteria bacterium]